MSFTENLREGRLGEDLISQWFIRRGWQVLPAYETSIISGKGPRLFGAYGQLICPDLLVFNDTLFLWIEAKFKSAFTWHRLSSSWQTGIDLRHWRDYQQVDQRTPMDVWIFFLHKPLGCAKDTPTGHVSPAGLFGQTVKKLTSCVHHTHANHGPSGMAYWTLSSFILLANWEDVWTAPGHSQPAISASGERPEARRHDTR